MMALTKILIILSLMAFSNAIFLWPGEEPGFDIPQNYYTRYPARPYAGFRDVMEFPFDFVFGGFPKFPTFRYPSPDDIKNTKTKPGQIYTGLYASTGGGENVIVANIDGQVLEKRFPESTSESSKK